MTRSFAIDEILRSLSPGDAAEFERMVYGHGKPRFDSLRDWLKSKGQKVSVNAVRRWYEANEHRYRVVPPEMALHQTLTTAMHRRDRLQAILKENWEQIEGAVGKELAKDGGAKMAFRLLDAIATLDLGVRVAAQQMHDLEVRVEQQKLVEATIHQVFSYIHLEMDRQGVDALRLEALEPMLNAVSDRIALENRFTKSSSG